MSTGPRAVLVTQAQRSALESGHRRPLEVTRLSLAQRYDAAGEQPRIRWCVAHGSIVHEADGGGGHCEKWWNTRAAKSSACRVVSALVVVLDQETEP